MIQWFRGMISNKSPRFRHLFLSRMGTESQIPNILGRQEWEGCFFPGGGDGGGLVRLPLGDGHPAA